MISIIIPVYNTEKYLDKCIQSILCQTYKELEIILVNDGSTDQSLQILEKYQMQDNRIRIISVENGGQGRARNIGIEQATGEFIMFVDSDDWLSENCVETLYHILTTEHCDVAIGDIAKTNFGEETIAFVYNPKIPLVINKENKSKFLFRMLFYPFAQLIRKSLFVEYGIFFPLHYFEDAATLPLIYAVADKICYQKDIVYYYRNRAGSTVNDIRHIYDRLQCVTTLEKKLKKLGLYEEYKESFLQYALQRSRINRRKVKELMDRQYQAFERRQFVFDYSVFGGIDDGEMPKAYVYGSYNLMIASKIFLWMKDAQQLPNYFGFQNIISSMSPKEDVLSRFSVASDNVFRENALVQDFQKSFLKQMTLQEDGVDYFILDFLNERYGTGFVSNGYFTLSEAFADIRTSLSIEYDEIKSFGNKWAHIWYDRCDMLIRQIRQFINGGKIILVKMKLAEKYVEKGKKYFFPDIKQIRITNDCLEQCYQYFIGNCPEALVIEVENLETYYTDKEFRHGCLSWHLNDWAYQEIAREMRKKTDYLKYMKLVDDD